jgi:formylglycine-generating enzyme required for sulfatase activity
MFSKAQIRPTIDWANIPAGTYTMGSPATEPNRLSNEVQHQVTLSAFKMSKYEVTITQFKAFVDSTGYATDAEKGKNFKGSQIWSGEVKEKDGVNWRYNTQGNIRSAGEYNHPVLYISWNDANAFAKWMDCRLPTEAEWEYACRAGTITPFYSGNSLSSYEEAYSIQMVFTSAWGASYIGETHPVGSFSPNGWGLYDMQGNVSEWCSDYYGEYATTPQANPSGPLEGVNRVMRGGSWISSEPGCRSAMRMYMGQEDRINFVGFRIVSDK